MDLDGARVLTVTMPGLVPPKEWSPNWYGHHLKRWAAGRDAKDVAHRYTSQAIQNTDLLWRAASGDPILVHIIVGLGKGAKVQDQTNLAGRLKPIEDGVAAGLGVNDKWFRLTYEQRRPKDGKPFVEIVIQVTEAGGVDRDQMRREGGRPVSETT